MFHSLFAGMATPLPLETNFVRNVVHSADARLQAISFFLLALLLCSAAVWGLWNYVRREWTALPRLSYPKAMGVTVLWGMLAFIVLTMISGARELMTPGAWKKSGFTYELTANQSEKDENPFDVRRRQLEELRTLLWKFAATHNGRFPSEGEVSEIPENFWRVPGVVGLRYRYVAGLKAESATEKSDLLVIEPELDRERRLVILTDGEIATRTTAEIQAKQPPKEGP